jgi:hypothetical protein
VAVFLFHAVRGDEFEGRSSTVAKGTAIEIEPLSVSIVTRRSTTSAAIGVMTAAQSQPETKQHGMFRRLARDYWSEDDLSISL